MGRRSPPPEPIYAASTHFRRVWGPFVLQKGYESMRVLDDRILETRPGTGRRHEAVRNEMFESHLFDSEAPEEKALCGGDSSPVERMSVKYYLEERLCGRPVGTICGRCKTLTMPLAEVVIEDVAEDLEDEGRLGDAEDYRELLRRLARETGLDRGTGRN